MERMAVLIVAGEVLIDGLGPLSDAGLRVCGSVGLAMRAGVGLVIAGEALPAVCDEPGSLKVVTILLTTESYGRQRLVRVAAITPTGETAADVCEGLGLEVRRLRAAPGDTIVVTTAQPLPTEVAERVVEKVRCALPDDHGCGVMVLDAGMKLEVLGKEA